MMDVAAESIGEKRGFFSSTYFILAGAILIFILGGMYYFYQSSGYREFKTVIAYLNTLKGDEKIFKYNQFYAIGSTPNLHGGILAATGSQGVWIWGSGGLMYYKVNDFFSKNPAGLTKTDNDNWTRLYYIHDGCAESVNEINQRSQTASHSAKFTSRFFEPIDTNPFIDLHLHMNKWRRVVRPGNYVQVLTNGENNNALSVTAESEFNGPKNWVICTVTPNEL